MLKKVLTSVLSALYIFIWGLNIHSVFGIIRNNLTIIVFKKVNGEQVLTRNIGIRSIATLLVVSCAAAIIAVLIVSMASGVFYLVKKKTVSAVVFCVFNFLLAFAYLFMVAVMQILPYFMTTRALFWWTGLDGIDMIQDIVYLYLPLVYAFIPLAHAMIKRRKSR